MMSITKTS